MASFFHPKLDLSTMKNIETVRQLMAEHPAYFLESPYSGEEEKLLKSWFDPKSMRAREAAAKGQADVEKNADLEATDKWEYLYQETSDLYRGLKTARHSMDGEEQMGYYRTATSLLQKLIELKERSMGLKQISEHNALILNIMESILSPTQRNEVMDQLKEAFGQ